MRQLKAYASRALELPLDVAIRKGAALLVRRSRKSAQKLKDRLRPSYGPYVEGTASLPIVIDINAIDSQSRISLAELTAHYLKHEFDLLGSGWANVGYGADVDGIENIVYRAAEDLRRVAMSRDPVSQLTRANRAVSAGIWSLVNDKDYQPIDWQRDFRSGYRWSARTEWTALRIGLDRGADIKWPWELSRMQHLSQLALAALAARANPIGFAPLEHYVQEIRNQILDFIAANPPRYGAAWGCPMDVAIRAANWVLVLGLLSGNGVALDPPFMAEFTRSLHDHASFIAANLEWSEKGRSNHYLSDLAGLLFAAACLPRTPESTTWINFASRELASETVLQFYSDGGNYEGSTSYHRLSAELSVYGLALALKLAKSEPHISEAREATVLSNLRTSIPNPEEPVLDALTRASERLGSMLAFTRAIRRPDGQIIQIGDTDSGRLFKFVPKLSPQDGLENHLAIDELENVLSVLLGGAARDYGVVGAITAALTGGHTFSGRSKSVTRPLSNQEPNIQRLRQDILNLPAESRRSWSWAAEAPFSDSPNLAAFPEFGLYVLSSSNLYLAFRCAAHHRSDAPLGHTHDDNLGIELVLDGRSLITDPGTYVYTSFPELRNAYRAAAAHFVPRAGTFSAVRLSDYLFQIDHLMTARCLYASSWALAGVLEGPAGKITRVVTIGRNQIDVLDGIEGGAFAPVPKPVTVAIGYGKKTALPAFAL